MSEMVAKTLREVIARHLASNWSRFPREDGERVYREEADRLLASLDAAGFVIVPKETIEAMVDKGDDALSHDLPCECDHHRVWPAMINAALKEPDQTK